MLKASRLINRYMDTETPEDQNYRDAVMDLAEATLHLDHWILMGGCLPSSWANPLFIPARPTLIDLRSIEDQ